jgi:hypothetical protein
MRQINVLYDNNHDPCWLCKLRKKGIRGIKGNYYLIWFAAAASSPYAPKSPGASAFGGRSRLLRRTKSAG